MSQASVGQGVSSESTDCMRGFCAAAWTCPQYEDGMGSEGRCRQRTRGFQRGPSREGHRAASWFSRGRREVWDILAFYEGFWRFLLCAVLSLVVFVNSEFSDVRSRCLYVLTLMVSCWLISSLSPYVVSLIPIVFFPLLKVESVGFVATSYMDSSSFLILGASMMVTALERAKLDVAVANALRSFAPSGTALLALYLMFVSFVSASCLTSIGTMLLICPVVEILRAKSQEQPAAALLSRAEDSGPGEGSFSPQAGEGEGAEQTVVTTADSSEEKLPSAASTQQNALFFRETLGSDSPVRVRGEAESQSLETGAGTARRRQQSLTEKPLKSSWPTTQGPELGDEAAAGGWLSLAKLEETSSSCLEMDSPKKKTDAPRDSGGLDGERPCCCLDSVAEESDLQRRSTQASAVCRNSPRFCCCPRCALNLNKAQPRGQPQLPRSLQDAGRLRDDHERLLLFMGCSFGATIGASLTLTSSGANAIFLSTLEALYGSLQPPQTNPVTFMTWMLLSIPVGTAQLLATWFTLVAAWLGPREALEASGVCLKALWLGLAGVCHSSYSAAINCLLARLLRRRASRSAKRGGGEAGAVAGEFEARRLEASAPSGEEGQTSSPSKAQPVVTKTFEAKTRSLVSSERASPSAPGPCFMARSYVVGSWVLLALLWITRRTVIPAIPGWGTFFGNFVDDSWPAMAVPLSFFFVPLEARTKTSSIVRLVSLFPTETDRPVTSLTRKRNKRASRKQRAELSVGLLLCDFGRREKAFVCSGVAGGAAVGFCVGRRASCVRGVGKVPRPLQKSLQQRPRPRRLAKR